MLNDHQNQHNEINELNMSENKLYIEEKEYELETKMDELNKYKLYNNEMDLKLEESFAMIKEWEEFGTNNKQKLISYEDQINKCENENILIKEDTVKIKNFLDAEINKLNEQITYLDKEIISKNNSINDMTKQINAQQNELLE